jgi:hypothetical protein
MNNPLNKFNGTIQLTAFHYIACLKIVPTNDDSQLRIGDKDYCFQNIKSASQRDLHINFQTWAAICTLRDLIENFSIFLMEIYDMSIILNPNKSYSSTLSQFERCGIERQLEILSKDFSIDAAWTSRLTGYNRARNSMAHRAGIISTADITEGDELVVRWLNTTISLQDGEISSVLPAHGPMKDLIQGHHVSGQAASLSISDREKRIRLGSALHFSPDEVLEICQTFSIAAAAFSTLPQQ